MRDLKRTTPSPWRLGDELERWLTGFGRETPVALFEGNAAPPIDVEELDDAFVITAELPGLSSTDIQLSVENDSLYIQGTKEDTRKENGKNYYRRERTFGSFSRAVRFPTMIDPEAVHAKFEDGVLTIQVEKAKASKRREIEIKAH